MNINSVKAIKSIWRFVLTMFDFILVGKSDKAMTPCYAPMETNQQHEEELSSASHIGVL